MGIGVSLLLIAAGAILTFALDVTVSGVDLDIVGWILMAVGVVGLIITIAMMSRARTTTTQRTISDPNRGGGPVIDEQRTRDEGGPPPYP